MAFNIIAESGRYDMKENGETETPQNKINNFESNSDDIHSTAKLSPWIWVSHSYNSSGHASWC